MNLGPQGVLKESQEEDAQRHRKPLKNNVGNTKIGEINGKSRFFDLTFVIFFRMCENRTIFKTCPLDISNMAWLAQAKGFITKDDHLFVLRKWDLLC